jgi:hypothetical protein
MNETTLTGCLYIFMILRRGCIFRDDATCHAAEPQPHRGAVRLLNGQGLKVFKLRPI